MPKVTPSTPRLCHYNYNMAKPWYVHFRYLDPNTGIREQFRRTYDLNRYHTKVERIREANAICKALKQKIHEGWLPCQTPEKPEYESIASALRPISAIRWESLRPKTRKTYEVVMEIFYKWLRSSGYNDYSPDEFRHLHALQYMDYLSTTKKLKGRTWNNHMIFMRIFFNYLVDREMINKNPFGKIKKQVETKSTRNYAYSDQEQELLNDYLYKNERRLYYFCRFIYGLYVRPNEAARLQIKDINFENWSINVYPDTSKTKKYRVAIIPDSYKSMFEEMRLQKYPADYYIFSKGCMPGEYYNPSFDKLTPKLKRINKQLGVNPKCTMYSWRHAGIIKLYTLLKYNIYECMQITGHTEMASFQNYLKTLGFSENTNFRSAMK